MRARKRLVGLSRQNDGATVVEFAIIAPIMLVLTMGMLELGYQAYVQTMLEGALNKAGRDSTLESGAAKAAEIDSAVQATVQGISRQATFTSTRKSYRSFSRIGLAEEFTDTNANGSHDSGECFVDTNGNGQWDAEQGADGQGGADDIVSYKMTVRYPLLFPLGKLLGWPSHRDISATTILRNQPFGAQQAEAVCA